MSPDYEPPAAMPSLLRALLQTSHERHWDMGRLVSGLPREALDWRPVDLAASIAGLVLHIVDVETYVARLAAGGEATWTGANGSRMDESAEAGPLLAAINDVDAELKRALGGLSEARLEAPTPDGEGSLGEDILSDLDHAAMHYGHLQLTRHLWEAAHPGSPGGYVHWR